MSDTSLYDVSPLFRLKRPIEPQEEERCERENLLSKENMMRLLSVEPDNIQSPEECEALVNDLIIVYKKTTSKRNDLPYPFHMLLPHIKDLIEDCAVRHWELSVDEELEEEERAHAAVAAATAAFAKEQEAERARAAVAAAAAAIANQYPDSKLDPALAVDLQVAIDGVTHGTNYIYLRRWVMPDGTIWFKIGITNNPARRESEQNVLPVPMETITCVDVGSSERARALEAAVHQVLDARRITGANNRELFHMTDAQVATIKGVIEKLS